MEQERGAFKVYEFEWIIVPALYTCRRFGQFARFAFKIAGMTVTFTILTQKLGNRRFVRSRSMIFPETP
jgi:hypothetical protein